MMGIINYMPSSGLNIDGLIKDYYVYAGQTINAGNFVEFVNGVSGQSTKTATKTTFQSNYSSDIRACEIDTNKALITYEVGFGGSSGGLDNPDKYKCRACVVTISNDTTITFGQEYEFYDYSDGVRYTSPILINIDTNKALYSYNYEVAEDNTEAYSMVISVSGNTITFGSKTKVSRTWGIYISSCKVDTNKAFISFQNSYSSNRGGGRVLSISGTTISTGSVTNFTSTSPVYDTRCTSPNTNKVVIAFNDGGNDSYGTLVAGTVSETSISFGSKVIYESVGIDIIATICGIDTDKTIMAYQNRSDDFSTMRIVTTSGNTITLNSGCSFSEGREIGWSIYMKKVDTNKAVILYKDYNTSATSTIMIVNVSGTNISFGARHNCHSYLNYSNDDSNNGIVLINNNRLFIAYDYTKYIYNNLMFISGTTVSNQLITTNYETQVKNTTSNPFDGIAKTSGTGGTSTAHGGQVSVYVPSVRGIPTDWTEITAGTEYVAQDGTKLTASGYLASNNSPPPLAFDRKDDTYWFSNHSDNNGKNVWLQLEFPSARTIKKIRSYLTQHQLVSKIDILGSNNGSTWTTLHTFTAAQAQFYTTTLTTNGSFKYYKIDYTMDSTGYVKVHGFEILE